MLQIIFRLLNDAEYRQLIGDQGVKSWLEDVKDLAYDVEDLLDVFALESVEQEQGKFLCGYMFPTKKHSILTHDREERERRRERSGGWGKFLCSVSKSGVNNCPHKNFHMEESSTSGGIRRRNWLCFPSHVLDGKMRSKMQDLESK